MKAYGEVCMVRLMRISLFFIFSPLFLLFFLPHIHAQEPLYADMLLESAHKKELHRDRYWHILLHYKKSPFGLRSLIDDPDFFLSKDGKYNPEAELKATIRAFFQEVENETRHPVCRFIARYAWLKEKLNIDASLLPVHGCERFNKIIDQIKPEAATLIFPTSHINSPASMFGHTLLTIETASRSKLLSYAINYSAVTNETFGPLFAVKGLFGCYKGYFSILPYYTKIQEYSDVNHRDIYEYPLNLNTEEINRLLMHIYELDFIYSDYYFFDENCSYDLLFLLEAARPSLNLTDQCNWWVIPIDTIRTIKKNGLFEGPVYYRPSKTTKIKYLISLLSKQSRQTALSMAGGDLEPAHLTEKKIPHEEMILISELACEYLQYNYTKKELTKKPYQDRFLKILRLRSLLGGFDENRYRIQAPPVKPEEGHLSNRFSIGIGTQKDNFFQELKFRPAYHAMLDDEKGYIEGSQIIFGETTLRYYSSERKLKLEDLDIIDIVSIAPRDEFFQSISWKIKTGLTQKIMEDGEDHLLYYINPGGGFAYKNNFLGLWYVMMETDFNLGGILEDRFSAGIGASTGFIKSLTDSWKVHFFTKDIYYGLGDSHNAFEITIQQNYSININKGLNAKISRRKEYHTYQTECKIHWNIFF